MKIACPSTFGPQVLLVFTSIFSYLPYFPIAGIDEDCLSINIWAPSTSRLKKGRDINPCIRGTNLVENQDIIVAELNYRVTIFGNPNSPYLASKGGAANVGLLDQRFAIEALVQSVAGYLPFAYPKNPIVTGIGNFTDLASVVGCAPGNTSDKQIFECMQNVPWKTLTDYIAGHPEKSYFFRIVADGITAFSDIPARIAAGKLAKIPQFNGQLDNEADSLIPSSPSGIDQATSDAFGHFLLVCPAAKEARSVLTLGSELSDTATLASTLTLPPTPLFAVIIPRIYLCGLAQLTRFQGSGDGYCRAEETVCAHARALAAFTKDPEQGLIKYGWPLYQGNKGKTLVHLDPRNSSETRCI
ncbi:carbohydrate esterase family 10 protein [Rhizoctonia solani]|uniref:Carbohydrate esterase family 10 protein n=1 Tax=Rhizoctonia solani TaxID=456999 RepID=A0A8H8T184_9AGAM|nr:carbohydrate esterase family 10 protein [Rhizoctonia solani]QRW25544.1 carbohydrate esterase family 10 protein [Rhizoctonia solani]